MNKMRLFVMCVMFVIVGLWMSAQSQAQSPFDGTWRTNLAQTKFSPKPIVFYIAQGWYHCVSCNPSFGIQADGDDHPVSGQTYDTIAVKVIDPNTIALTTKKSGKITSESTRAVSADGKTLTVKTTGHPMNSDQPVTSEVIAKRAAVPPSGVHATSGEWLIEKVQESDNGVSTTYKMNGDELTMTSPTGESYTAKLDGSDYPFKGSYSYDAVSLKKIDAHTIEETDKRGGNIVEVAKLTVSGNKMTIVADNKVTGRTSTYIAEKK
jgi:hypothetical protein